MKILFVGFGGCLGAISRYFITLAMNKAAPSLRLGTLLSNILASLIIGFIIGAERQTSVLSDNTRLFLITGCLGGLSTFSTFSMETVTLFESGKYMSAFGNILLNVCLCLLFVVIGMSLAKTFVRSR